MRLCHFLELKADKGLSAIFLNDMKKRGENSNKNRLSSKLRLVTSYQLSSIKRNFNTSVHTRTGTLLNCIVDLHRKIGLVRY